MTVKGVGRQRHTSGSLIFWRRCQCNFSSASKQNKRNNFIKPLFIIVKEEFL